VGRNAGCPPLPTHRSDTIGRSALLRERIRSADLDALTAAGRSWRTRPYARRRAVKSYECIWFMCEPIEILVHVLPLLPPKIDYRVCVAMTVLANNGTAHLSVIQALIT
jgi:hypothetical protein